MPRTPRAKRDPTERFNEKWVESTENFYNDTPCWEWTACTSMDGYARFSNENGVTVNGYRWGYEQAFGPLPKGLQPDHLCENRGCVNPNHMEAVTSPINTSRGKIGRGETGKAKSQKTHCEKGHPFSAENTYIGPNGVRHCRICRRQADERRKLRNENGETLILFGEERTHCRSGHLLTEENTYYEDRHNGDTTRRCRICKRERDRRFHQKQRQAKRAQTAAAAA